MKKVIIFLLVFILIGCDSNDKQLDEFSNLIIDSHQTLNLDTSNLNDYNEKLFINFINSQKKENKVVNLSNLEMFGGEDFETDEPESEEVYFLNENYYIKYTDLVFENINNIFVTTVIAGGYELEINKSQLPILYEETNNINYQYRFMKKETEDNIVKYHYRSYGNGSMLTIEYEMEDNKIKTIDLIYDDYYTLEDENIDEEQSKAYPIINLVLTFSVLVITIVVAVKLFFRK